MFKNWSNKEFDGTMFIAFILIAFVMSIVFTFINPAFAELSTTLKVFEIIKDILLIIVGYLFKKAVDGAASNKE